MTLALVAATLVVGGCSGGGSSGSHSSGSHSSGNGASSAAVTGTGPSTAEARPSSPAATTPPTVAPSASHRPATVNASVAPFRLPATLSRAVAYPAGTHLLLATGLHDGERSTGAVLDVDVPGNRVTVAGRLPQAVHDAAGATLGGSPTTFGGGAATEVATIQQYVPAQRRPTAIEF